MDKEDELIKCICAEAEEEDLVNYLNIYYWKQKQQLISSKEFIWHDFEGNYGSLNLFWLHRLILENGHDQIMTKEFVMEYGDLWNNKFNYEKLLSHYFDFYIGREIEYPDSSIDDFFNEILMILCAIGPIIKNLKIYNDALKFINYIVENNDDRRVKYILPHFFIIPVLDLNYPKEKAFPTFIKLLELDKYPNDRLGTLCAIIGIRMYGDQLIRELKDFSYKEKLNLLTRLAIC